MFLLRKCIHLTYFVSSYSPTGIGKAKSAMEAARAKKSKLMTSQKEEDEKIQNMADWSPDQEEADDSRAPLMSREDNVCIICYWYCSSSASNYD